MTKPPAHVDILYIHSQPMPQPSQLANQQLESSKTNAKPKKRYDVEKVGSKNDPRPGVKYQQKEPLGEVESHQTRVS